MWGGGPFWESQDVISDWFSGSVFPHSRVQAKRENFIGLNLIHSHLKRIGGLSHCLSLPTYKMKQWWLDLLFSVNEVGQIWRYRPLAWWGWKTLVKYLPLPYSKGSESSHNAIMSPAFLSCLKQPKNQAEYINNSLETLAIKDSDSQETGYNMSPMIAPAYCLERFPRLQQRDRESRQSLT